MENCCENRPNFGRPVCVDDFGTITTVLLVPSVGASGSKTSFGLNINYNDFITGFYANNPADRIYGFPQMENVEYSIADSLKEEGASGRMSFLRNGVITLTAETWDKDGTAVIKGKMAQLRCADWGIFFVTDKNLVIGSKQFINYGDGGSYRFAPIKIDSQSVDSKFMFKTNTTTQKVMLTFNLDRNFDDSTYYAISGDELWSNESLLVESIDFNDVPKVIDCQLALSEALTTTQAQIAINDDYRQGNTNINIASLGNVTGLEASDFVVTNVTDLTPIVISTVIEEPSGNYIISYPSQTSGDKIKVDLFLSSTNSINYNGSITYLIP
jgi:hypothetical protein